MDITAEETLEQDAVYSLLGISVIHIQVEGRCFPNRHILHAFPQQHSPCHSRISDRESICNSTQDKLSKDGYLWALLSWIFL